MDVKDSHFGFHRSYIPFIGSGCRLMRPRFQACANYPSCSDDTTSGYNPTTSGYNPTSESTAPPHSTCTTSSRWQASVLGGV